MHLAGNLTISNIEMSFYLDFFFYLSGGIIELEKDVVLAIMMAEKGPDTDKLPRNLTVGKLGMKWALSNSRALSLGHVNMKPKVEDVKRILARLKFSAVPQRVSL